MLLRSAAVILLSCGLALPTLASASRKPFGEPSPTDLDLRGFSKDQIRARFKDACIYSRARTATMTDALAPGCACYATKLVASMTDAELDAFRASGRFDRTTRPKAEAALGECLK